MYIQDCDLCLPLPMAIDDALLTTAGAFPQPAHTTPVLAGFHFGVRLFRLLGVILTSHRNLSASWLNPATDPFPMLNLSPMPVQIRPSQQFFDELERIIADLPGPLQLANPTGNGSNHPSSKSTPPTIIPSGGETAAAKDLGFAICRANLLVNQAMVRFAIRQYARAVGEEEGQDGGKEWAERDVLSLLESMSSESLAANGESLRRKVLFVASSLLEQHKSTSEGHNYVSDFLAVFTRISEEQHATLLEDSAAPSREPSPGPGGGGGGAVGGGGGGGGGGSMGLLTSLTAGDS
ncbi:hypothetical protein JCM24511_04309 [Saitozyma sp. JCM 24511]|nr:hypothetical protein JCM24511_04309 [Saitozyma sp. JCM 24511]